MQKNRDITKRRLRQYVVSQLAAAGFRIKGSKGVRNLFDQQQTVYLRRGKYRDAYSLDYWVTVFRSPTDDSKEYGLGEHDLGGDVRDISGGEQSGSLWQRAFDLDSDVCWDERKLCIEEVIQKRLIPRLEELRDIQTIRKIIQCEPIRRQFLVGVSLRGYELIGGYDNVISSDPETHEG